ncbi:MAG TPA: toxin-antitoxin system antitoxin subunit, partial [Cutibacterium acnes]|nr:toxin-antitoxin system antitoxin subunit [Cutibacterium acnes]
LTLYAGGRRATKPARQESIFDTSDLTTTAIDSETVLNDLRGKR